MKHIVFFLLMPIFLYSQEEFIKVKTKTKKEIALHVKEDIAELYESMLRQIGNNINQSVDVQNQIFDKIKKLMNDASLSTYQLKELRHKLENYLKKLEEQEADLHNFLLLCS